MLDTVTTVVVAGIAAAVAVPKMNLSSLQSDASLRQVSSILVGAQRTALSKQHNVIMAVNYGSKKITIVEDKNNSGKYDFGERVQIVTLDKEIKFRNTPTPLAGFTGKGGIANTVNVASTSGWGIPVTGDLVLTFRRNGAASGDAALFFTAKEDGDDSFRAVLVTQSTGRTDGYRYNGSAWVRADS